MNVNYFFHPDKALDILYAIGILLVGYFISRKLSSALERSLAKRFSQHQTMLVARFVFYSVFLIFIGTSLQHLGFKLSVVLGAAGVFTVAIGFASQTAASNLMSGIFLLFERPFKVGDNVEVKGISGIVNSIDLLSTKLKTSDNKLIRIPNEAMIKSEITNLSFFPTRRLDLLVGIRKSTDISPVKSMLLGIANQFSEVLKDPEPRVIIHLFSPSAIELKLMVWVKTEEMSATYHSLQETIQGQMDEKKIETPAIDCLAHRTTSSRTE